MKPKKEITYCEYCNKIIYLASPPPKEQYDNGEILIRDGSVLIPDEVVSINKDGSHSKDISGYYCDIECLVNYLKKILHPKVIEKICQPYEALREPKENKENEILWLKYSCLKRESC